MLIIVAVSIFTYTAIESALVWLGWDKKSPEALWRPIAFLVGTGAVLLLNSSWRWVWKKAPALSTVIFPDLTGEWKGVLHSSWVNPETNEKVPPIKVRFFISQSLLSFGITLQTKESKSYSNRYWLERRPDQHCYRLWYTYTNEPKQAFRFRSSEHAGVAFLELDLSSSRDHLTGRYFTSRNTTGDIELERS
ncbi:MAG: hypothetical protein KDA56_09215 [Hyphomonas sp.]|nr:hypothetical protein [Hyphomonas sp.]